jgi:nanoRNase/pAp phosphatase (c-di-AMP/oligoRNAs hydrolase)
MFYQAEMTMQNILRVLEETEASFVFLLCHQNADPDALGSAFAFQGLLKRLVPNVVVEMSRRRNRNVQTLIGHLLLS